MFEKMIGGAIAKIVGEGAGVSVVEYFDKKQQIKQELKLAKLNGKIAVVKAKADFKVKQLDADNKWELAQIQNSGFKDEWVLGLLSVPLIMVFIPPLQQYVLSGFAVLEQCPDWYRWLVVVIFAAIYGVRVWRRKSD